MALRPKLFDDSAHMERVENDDGVGDQVEASGLKVQRFVFQAVELAVLAEQQRRPKAVQCFALVELLAHPLAGVDILVPAQDVDRLFKPSEFL